MNSDTIEQTSVSKYEQTIATQKKIPFEKIIAILFLLTGYFICRFIPFSEKSMGASLLMFVLAILATIYLMLIKKGQKRWKTILECSIPVALSFTMIIQNDTEGLFSFFMSGLYFFSLLYIFAGNCGVLIEKYPGKYLIYDIIRIIFIYPFGRICHLFIALFSRKNDPKNKIGKIIACVVLGLLVAAVPVVFVILLLSYDEGFVRIIKNIFSFEIEDFISHVFSFILGIPLAMMMFSAVFSCVRNEFPNVLTKEKSEVISHKSKFLPLILSCVAIIPFITVYVIFFISQKDYYFAALGGVLPSGYSFSKYAVEGFENLCVVSAINGMVLWVFHCFTKKNKDFQNSIAERIGTVLISLSTLLLILTAFAKLVLYINEYGFTVKRFYAGWFMLLLFLVFLAVIIKQFINKMKLNTVIVLIFFILFSIISLYDWRGFMANYNAEFYMNGQMDKVNEKVLSEFGDSAVPAMVRFVNYGYDSNGYVSRQLSLYLDYQSLESGNIVVSHRDFLARNIPYYCAKAAIARLDFEKMKTGLDNYKANKQQNEINNEDITVTIINKDVENDLFVSALLSIDECISHKVIYEEEYLSYFIMDNPNKAVIPISVVSSLNDYQNNVYTITLYVYTNKKENILAGIEYEEVFITLSYEDLLQNGYLLFENKEGEYCISYEN